MLFFRSHWKRLRCFVFFVGVLAIGGCSKPGGSSIPSDVLELFVSVNSGDPTLFSTEYYVLPNGPLQSHPPGSGTRFEKRQNFDGSVIPLAITTTGELRYPLRVFVTRMPSGEVEVSYWKPGMHVDIPRGQGVYRYKLRADETGLCFVVFVEKTTTIHVFPTDLKPLRMEELPQKPLNESQQAIRFLEIPDPMKLPLAPQAVVNLVNAK